MKINRKKQKGFTLIELVVVIGILGILAAIVVPKVGTFREKAEAAAFEADERIMKSAAQMLIAEKGLDEAAGTYSGPEGGDLLEYINEWPDTVQSVEIKTNGEIILNPKGLSEN